jgi:predicted metal-dependent enzyme (double-stranded beta helix superfamily)
MRHTLQSFAASCHEILDTQDNAAGRREVATLLAELLADPAFVAAQFDAASPERKILYEDAQLGFCILAHNYTAAKDSGPHDHGPSWAIYGQATGETAMSDYALVQPPAGGAPGQVRKTRSYKLTPGAVHVYNEGDLHSPSRAGPTRLIRIEGTNMEKVQRAKYVEVIP